MDLPLGERTPELAPRPLAPIRIGDRFGSRALQHTERGRFLARFPLSTRSISLCFITIPFPSVRTCILNTTEQLLDTRMPMDLVQFRLEGGTGNDVEDQR